MNQKPWWYDLQFLRYRVWQNEIGNYGKSFALLPPPSPPKNLKNQNFKKCKKHAGEIIILHVCTKSHNHMSYNSWDMECNRHNYWPQKLKFGESVKKPWKCHDFKLVYQKSWSYAILFLRYSMWQIVIFHSGLFFALLFP